MNYPGIGREDQMELKKEIIRAINNIIITRIIKKMQPEVGFYEVDISKYYTK